MMNVKINNINGNQLRQNLALITFQNIYALHSLYNNQYKLIMDPQLKYELNLPIFLYQPLNNYTLYINGK